MPEYGCLEVACGPMFSGKTEWLVRKYEWLVRMNARPIAFRPRHDTRNELGIIRSHSGASIPATTIGSWPGLRDAAVQAVLFDEAQFVTRSRGMFDGDLLTIVRDLREQGVSVYAAGLDMDFRGHGFDVTARLMAESSKVRRMAATCAWCGAVATMTARTGKTSGRYAVGGWEDYRPACRTHWRAYGAGPMEALAAEAAT